MKIIKVLLLMFLFNHSSMANNIISENIYSYSFETIDGKGKIKLEDYKGKLIIIVNTASLCGFTKQFASLQEIWVKYKDRGLVIIGVPSNNFGNQEPGRNSEIQNFCSTKFNISFPLAAKTDIKGDRAHPFFIRTRAEFGRLSGPSWNFYKYIISPEGKLLAWYTSLVDPKSKKFISFIEKNLPKKVD
ncbi:MAG: btuE [Rickettsiaceae bacterium]|jgi:glutathione peroxidase|nr:btuE [Rickettsiaceae bacterium]